MKYFKNKIMINNKGSSLVMVLIIMLTLTVLGIGILTSSMNNLNISIKLADYERAYYAAEAGAKQGVDFVKDQVSSYYMDMYNSNNKATYLGKYTVFYIMLADKICTTSANCEFEEPEFREDSLGISTTTTITIGSSIFTEPAGPETFTISCKAEVNGVKRIVISTIEVDKVPILWQYSTVPIKTEEVVLSAGNIDVIQEAGEENTFIVDGDVRIAGQWYDEFESGMIAGWVYSEEDITAIYDLGWKLEFEKFAAFFTPPDLRNDLAGINITIVDPTPFAGSNPPQIAPTADYEFYGDVTISEEDLTDIDIYCDGNLTIEDSNIVNCHITATGNLVIVDTDPPGDKVGYDIIDTTIYAGGNLTIVCDDIENTSFHYMYAIGDISIAFGHEGKNKGDDGNIENAAIESATGSLFIDSNRETDQLINSFFYAKTNINIGKGLHDLPILENIDHCLFYSKGTINSIATNTMKNHSLIYAMGDIQIVNYETIDSEIYARGDLIFDVSSLANVSSKFRDAYSDNVVFAANNNVNINLSFLKESYIFAGNELNILFEFTSSRGSLENCIIYSENDITYILDWSTLTETVNSTLLYTNGDFLFGGRGTNPQSWLTAGFAGMQLMVKGNIISYEENNNNESIFEKDDKLAVGYGNDNLDISIIHANIGNPDPIRGILADQLYDHHFEQNLDEDDIIRILPPYDEVFLSETTYELNMN